MCSRCPVCCLKDLRGPGDFDVDDGAHTVCPQGRSAGGSCDAFRDNHCLGQMIIICSKYEQTEDGELFSRISQATPQRRRVRRSRKWLLMTCLLVFLLAFTFLMGKVGREENRAHGHDTDVFPVSRAVWLLGLVLFWTVWLLLRLLQMILCFLKGLLWLVSVSASPLCCCLSSLLSCVLVLLHYFCEAVCVASSSPAYVCLAFVSSLFVFTLTCGSR